MTKRFEPDYTNIEKAASNVRPPRVPLYEHGVHPQIMEEFLGQEVHSLQWEGSFDDKVEAYRRTCDFFVRLGYDVIPVEFGATALVQGGYGLCGRTGPVIRSMDDLESWDWVGAIDHYIELFDDQFRAMAQAFVELWSSS